MTLPHATAADLLNQRTIALAAMSQAVFLVNAIAMKGRADESDGRVLVECLFASPAAHDTDCSLYGDPAGLKTGLRTGIRLLSAPHEQELRAMMIYSSGLLTLENKLQQQRPMLEKLGEGIHRIDKQRQYFGDVMHPSVTAAIADLYGETVSTIKPRIIVRGKSEHLSRSENPRMVRTLLLAGLRSAHLWKKSGGSRLNLFLKRKTLIQEMQRILDSIQS